MFAQLVSFCYFLFLTINFLYKLIPMNWGLYKNAPWISEPPSEKESFQDTKCCSCHDKYGCKIFYTLTSKRQSQPKVQPPKTF